MAAIALAPHPNVRAAKRPRRSCCAICAATRASPSASIVLLLLVAFTVIGFLTVDPKHAYPLAAPTKRPPSWQYPLGTDFFGRDLLAAMVVGMWQTAAIGVIAGGLGTLIGVVLGFMSAYFGGWIDVDHSQHLPDPHARSRCC